MTPTGRTVGPDGDVHLLLPAGSPAVRVARHAAADELTAVLELIDVAPVAVPHRIRGRAWVTGWLTAVPGRAAPERVTLRLETGEVAVDDLWGAASVPADAFAEAAPDPLAAHEAELLQHLAAHPDLMDRLRVLAGRPAAAGPAVPLALDRFGLRVRFRRDSRMPDARFAFPRPVRCAGDLRRALHALCGAVRQDARGE